MTDLRTALSEAFGNRTPALAKTENGAAAYVTTGNELLDLFMAMPLSGGGKDISDKILAAIRNDARLAAAIALYSRDPRNGQGTRDSLFLFISCIMPTHQSLVLDMVRLLPVFGRWKDAVVVYAMAEKMGEERLCLAISQMILDGLEKGEGLVAKWLPRESGSMKPVALSLSKRWGWRPAQYRKRVAAATSVVENLMSSGRWGEIEYSHTPSRAMAIYKQAFRRHDEARFGQYLSDVESGKVKINAGVLYPYELIKGDDSRVADAQWKALPDFVKEGMSIFPIIDVSWSMTAPIRGSKFCCMDVAIALGIYLAERNKSAFKSMFMTFSSEPDLVVIPENRSIYEKYEFVKKAEWEGTTDIWKAFHKLIAAIKKWEVSSQDTPNHLLIISDMQFDEGAANTPPLEQIKKMWFDSLGPGYIFPEIVWWDVRATDNSPAHISESGVSLVSGFSPAIVKNVLSGVTSPVDVMLKTVQPYVDMLNKMT